MAEYSYLWSHPSQPGDGTAAMNRTDWSTQASILAACGGMEGVAANYLNSCAGTVMGANTVQIDTGGAVVDGKPYNNSAPLSINIPSTVTYTRIDRIVLRANWSAQTVRLTRIAGTEASSPIAPAITQTSGTTYDIKLYRALVNTTGTVTLTDERTMASTLITRQGGDGYAWPQWGAVNYIPTNWKIQVGATALPGNAAQVSITFPVPFNASCNPIVFITEQYVATGYGGAPLGVSSVAYNSVTIGTNNYSSIAYQRVFTWLAIGPM